ncbi:uncharacterized protein LOC132208302 [Stegostoma tigrinum]|uniref:uncharacterized protein LOC132208302 n=1 Tax=Stegostoma tigrinum TaxID=3053191 RepID=UPI00287065FF|nr:uncharacterized protein LOC132208302 [Stegostoma tigrinum]
MKINSILTRVEFWVKNQALTKIRAGAEQLLAIVGFLCGQHMLKAIANRAAGSAEKVINQLAQPMGVKERRDCMAARERLVLQPMGINKLQTILEEGSTVFQCFALLPQTAREPASIPDLADRNSNVPAGVCTQAQRHSDRRKLVIAGFVGAELDAMIDCDLTRSLSRFSIFSGPNALPPMLEFGISGFMLPSQNAIFEVRWSLWITTPRAWMKTWDCVGLYVWVESADAQRVHVQDGLPEEVLGAGTVTAFKRQLGVLSPCLETAFEAMLFYCAGNLCFPVHYVLARKNLAKETLTAVL